jgi:hypothetical protein
MSFFDDKADLQHLDTGRDPVLTHCSGIVSSSGVQPLCSKFEFIRVQGLLDKISPVVEFLGRL